MKNWKAAEIVELNITETAQNVFGNSYDNGYIGDGHLGLLEWKDNSNNGDGNNEEPGNKLS